MKIAGHSVLLSIALLTSTVYLVIHQSSRGQNLESDKPTDPCLFFDVKSVEDSPLKFIYAQNICQKPTRFAILFNKYEISSEEDFVTSCLQQNEEEITPFVYTFSKVNAITHEDC